MNLRSYVPVKPPASSSSTRTAGDQAFAYESAQKRNLGHRLRDKQIAKRDGWRVQKDRGIPPDGCANYLEY